MNLEKEVRGLLKGSVCFGEPLSGHTSFRIGGPAEVWAEPEDTEDLANLLKYSSGNRISTFTIGGGNNLLVGDEGVKGITLNLGSSYFKKVEPCRSALTARAGANLARLVEVARANSLGGLEFMTGIPGTVGGAVMMNAGCKGKSLGALISEVRVMDARSGQTYNLRRDQIDFDYRRSGLEGYIILDICLQLERKAGPQIDKSMKRHLKMKRQSQELDFPSAGSVFKNPKGSLLSSGQLIELTGLKGRSVGDAQVSSKHCNFIVNRGNASAKDVMELIEIIRGKVRSDHGLDLELEIKVIGVKS